MFQIVKFLSRVNLINTETIQSLGYKKYECRIKEK